MLQPEALALPRQQLLVKTMSDFVTCVWSCINSGGSPGDGLIRIHAIDLNRTLATTAPASIAPGATFPFFLENTIGAMGLTVPGVYRCRLQMDQLRPPAPPLVVGSFRFDISVTG